MIGRRTFLSSAGALAFAAPAFAQSNANQGDASTVADLGFSGRAAVPHLTAEQATNFAKQIEEDLARRQTRLALVFRTGRTRDKLPEGIAYTHGAFWAYVPIRLADGRTINGYAVYNLYHGDGTTLARDRSYLHQDFPLDFVRGSAVDDVAVIVPSPEMQRRIMQVMISPVYQRMHVASYSLIANPLDARHQNCNEFMLDVIGAAAWNTDNYEQVVANLREHYRPTRVRVNVFQRAFGPMSDPRVKMDDQRGRIVTATYESMAVFMRDNNLLQENYVLNRAV